MSPLFVLIAALGTADVATTVIALKRGGTELNPVARPLFRRFGTLPVAIALKVIFIAAVFALALMYPQPAFLVGIAFLQAGIVANNLFVLGK